MVWYELIACYLFLAGLGAGAFVLGALSSWSKTSKPHLKKAAYVIAPVAVIVGTLLLVVDARAGLHAPLRFLHLVSNLSSIMAWGVIILSLFIIVSSASLILLLAKKSTPKALDVVGMALALCVAAYTGVLLGDAGMAFPLWNMAVLPALFVVSAASTGFAAVLLATGLVAPEETKAYPLVSKTGIVLPVLEAVLIAVLLIVTAHAEGSAAVAGSASVEALLTGSYAPAFWICLVVVGLVLPLGIELGSHRVAAAPEDGSAAKRRPLALAGEAGVLIGGFTLRYLVVMAAVAVGAAA